MQTSKNIIKAIIFTILLILCIIALNFLLVPYSSMMKRFRGYRAFMQENDNIDVLVLGSSQEFDGFDADVLNAELGKKSYVFCVQGGMPETSYYLLLDVLQKNTPETLIVGWDTLGNFEKPRSPYPSNRRAQMYRELLKDSKNANLKSLTIKNMLDQRYTMTLFEYAAFPENITEIKAAIASRELLKEPWKQTESTSGTPMSPENPKDFQETVSKNYTPEIDKNDADYMLKICDICRNKGINLYVSIGTYPKCVKDALNGKYEQLYNSSIQFFKENNIAYIDTESSLFAGIDANENFHDCAGHLILSAKKDYTKRVCTWIGQLSF